MDRLAHIKSELSKPGNHPDNPKVVTIAETHISILFMTPEYVYKLKKPVNLGFLDFSTLDRRFYFCNEELRLNRRYSPDIYIGLSRVNMTEDRISIDGEGETIDFMVRMKRLPDELMLQTLIANDDPSLPSFIQRIGNTIAQIHAASPPIHNGLALFDLSAQNWQENFQQTLQYVGTTIEKSVYTHLEQYVFSFLDRHTDLINHREKEGYFRDCHGDLHSSHICCTDPISIFDCIEFNQRFRLGDTLCDLAFLLMDLDHLGRRDLSSLLLQSYFDVDELDTKLRELTNFYKIYRAYVRAKVLSFLSDDPGLSSESQQIAVDEARSYFNLATGYHSHIPVILTCGLMGSGKSSLASSISKATGAKILCSDRLRKEMFNREQQDDSSEGFQEGVYSPNNSEQVYCRLMEKTIDLASTDSGGVIVDASFSGGDQRKKFISGLQRNNIPYRFVHLHAELDCLHRRLENRQQNSNDWSDGRSELLDKQIESFTPLDTNRTIDIDSQRSIEYNTSLVLRHFIEGGQ